jgi:hypothetical protein
MSNTASGQLTQRVPNSAGGLDAYAKSVTVPSEIGRLRPVITVLRQRVRPQLQAVR